MANSKYKDIILDIRDGIGTIKFNRPESLNSFGGNMIPDTIGALRELNNHPDTTFTVLTGEGRFFASGADVNAVTGRQTEFQHEGEKKVYWTQMLGVGMELVRSMIEHKKVLVLAMNGPGVGAGASWFQGVSDLFFAAEGAWLQVTFSQLGLVPEAGSVVNWAQSMGVHRANEWLMFGGKATVEELYGMGLINQIFPKEDFHNKVHEYLKDMLKDRSGKAMIETKRMQNQSLRDQRILALFDAFDGLAERFVDGEPMARMKAKMEELKKKRESKASKL